MKIIIDTNKDGVVTNFDIKGGKCSIDELFAVFFSILDPIVKKAVKDVGNEELTLWYDYINSVFETFFRSIFPELPEGVMELSDAAVLYAQDKIIDEAEKKGLTFQEAMAKFESRAKEYVRQKREGLS